MKKNSKGIISNVSWKFAERITAQLVSTIVSVILARLLDPEHYGIIAIVMIFINLANVFVSDGLGSALIQRKNADSLDYSSVLYFNIGLSIFLYLLLFCLAPLITKFYGSGYELLTPVLRILGIRLILSAINSVQQAYVSKHMIFKKFFWATLFGTLISAAVGISMAYNGYGVWALVAQYLTNTTVDTIVLALTLKKIPVFKFSWERVRGMIGFGARMLMTSLLITGYQELRAVIIGKLYSSSDLAYYDKGRHFPRLIINNINTSIGAVLFPKMSNEQDDINALKTTTRNSIRFSSYLMSPMMLGLAAVGESFIRLLLTDKWLPAVPLLRLFCIIYLFQPIHTANMQAIKAVGRGDTYFRLELIKKAIELIVLISVMRVSVEAIVISMAVLTTLYTFVNSFPNKKYINYSFREQMKDIFPAIGMSCIMAGVVMLIEITHLPTLVLFFTQIIAGVLVYWILSAVTKNKEYAYIKKSIISFARARK